MRKNKIDFLVYILFAICVCHCSLAQKENNSKISRQEYKVLNDFFSNLNQGSKTRIYCKTFFDKGWVRYFNESGMTLIESEIGTPTTISFESLDSMLTKKRLSKIASQISISRPIKINQKKLNESIELVDKYDEEGYLNVRRISRPIILDDLAIFRMLSFDEAPIFIMKKEKDNWEVVYTFYDWLILE
ncbi:hypothetical protein [uncultured Croceitalea sp.]|uniref:hypothetical protein n=1 Tax=uncultured Croceitalea sp. TaxID=1798908 RepID=UPI003305C96A